MLNSCLPHGLNGSAPERAPTVNVTEVTYTGIGANVVDVFVTDRGNVGDPPANGNAVTARQTPVAGTPFAVYLGGPRLTPALDYTLAGRLVTLTTATLNAGNVILLDYWTANP